MRTGPGGRSDAGRGGAGPGRPARCWATPRGLDFLLTDAARTEDRRGRPGVAYTDVESQLVLAPGESAVVGAIDGEQSGREAGTAGAAASRARSRKLLVVRAEIVP